MSKSILGDGMAEAVRTDNQWHAQEPDAPRVGDSLTQAHSKDQQPALPETAQPANSPALNRSAEAIGRGVGTAVSGVRQIPRQFDRLRSRIYLVSDNTAASMADLRDSAEARATEWRDAAEMGLLELADKASVYTSTIRGRANGRLREFRRHAGHRLGALRHNAQQRLEDAGDWRPQRPLQVIAASAGAAFVVGVMLRVWRSSHD